MPPQRRHRSSKKGRILCLPATSEVVRVSERQSNFWSLSLRWSRGVLSMNRFAFQLGLAALALGSVQAALGADAGASANAVASPPLPVIHGLKLQPDTLTLKDGRDERRVLVWGKTDEDKWIDLTSRAILKSDSTNVEIDSFGYIRAKEKGHGEVTVTAAGQRAKLVINVEDAGLP